MAKDWVELPQGYSFRRSEVAMTNVRKNTLRVLPCGTERFWDVVCRTEEEAREFERRLKADQ